MSQHEPGDDERLHPEIPDGWYVDPLDPDKARYWRDGWIDPGVPRGAGDLPTFPAPPPRRAWARLALAALAGVAIGVGATLATGAFTAVKAPEAPKAPDMADELVYTFVSPSPECCSLVRAENTSTFDVSGKWRIEWTTTGEGEACEVRGRINDPAAKRVTDLKEIGPALRGSQDYDGSGTYSITLTYQCPPESVAGTQLRVYD